MKVCIQCDELYPHFSLSPWGQEVDIDEEAYLQYQEFMEEFKSWQDYLRGLYISPDLSKGRSPEYIKAMKKLLLEGLQPARSD